MRWGDFDWLIDAALAEDATRQDVTTSVLVPPDRQALAELQAHAAGVICGLPLVARVATRFDERLKLEECVRDGQCVAPGMAVARLSGRAASILSIERTALNFLGRLSGVATLTARFVERVEGTRARIYDTRKTTPGWRELEKYAVRCGGGCNHRMNLADQALIKDNHLALLGGGAEGLLAVRKAVGKVRDACPGMEVEIEVKNLLELEAALEASPDVIMLDNMSPAQVRQAAALVSVSAKVEKRPLLEASGLVTLETVRDYAEAGADRISIGALTHSAPALNLSLEIAN